jgi:hypothetical protein
LNRAAKPERCFSAQSTYRRKERKNLRKYSTAFFKALGQRTRSPHEELILFGFSASFRINLNLLTKYVVDTYQIKISISPIELAIR